MRVNPNSEPAGIPPVPGSPPRKARLGQDEATLSSTESLNRSLELTPTVRPDQVERAKGLIDDPKYPPDVVIRKIADLLAIHLDDQTP